MNILKFIIINLLLIQVSFLGAQNSVTLDVKYFPAQGELKNSAIIMLGGAESEFPNSDFYTKRGYPLREVAYFRTQKTPKMLEMIPLKYVKSYYHITWNCLRFKERE